MFDPDDIQREALEEALTEKLDAANDTDGLEYLETEDWDGLREHLEQQGDIDSLEIVERLDDLNGLSSIDASLDELEKIRSGNTHRPTLKEACKIINDASHLKGKTDPDSIVQKNMIVAKVLHDELNTRERDFVREALKTVLGIPKQTTKEVRQTQIPKQTHATWADKMLTIISQAGRLVYAEDDLWQYDRSTGIWLKLSREIVIRNISRLCSGPRSRTDGDYRSIYKTLCRFVINDNFWTDAPFGFPAKTYFHKANISKRTIEKLPYTPELRQRWKNDFDPDDRDMPWMWLDFLEETFAGTDTDAQIMLLQEIMGAILFCIAHFGQVCILFIGPGANGKSLILDVIRNLLPPNMVTSIAPEQFQSDYHRAELAGKCLNIAGDISSDTPLSSAEFKAIVGGDAITARKPYGAPFVFRPRAMHLFSANSPPRIKDYSIGFFRRWVLFECPNTVPEYKRNPSLAHEILAREKPKLLSWCLEGAKRYLEAGMKYTITDSNKKLMDQWRILRDSVHSFLADETVVIQHPDIHVPKRDLYDTYRDWCADTGHKPVHLQEFYARVQGAGIQISRPRTGDGRRHHFMGVGLVSHYNL